MDNKKTFSILINGIPVDATYFERNIDDIFLPLLRNLTKIQREKKRRILVIMAAPPGTGKSTLATFFEYLSSKYDDIEPIQYIGMDGFHHLNTYLESHHIDDDPTKPMLRTIKGSPQSFDVNKLISLIKEVKEKNIVWPIYSRTIHDVIDDGPVVNSNIVLLEGNYLLLDFPPWNEIQKLADYSIFINSPIELLKEHIIARKISSGCNEDEAISFYNHSDYPNIMTVLNHSKKADINLFVDTDMIYSIK